MKTFSFRFDIDSLADIEIGVPKLIEIGRRLDVRFSFFINMGKSFNWGTLVRGQSTSHDPQSMLRTTTKLGFWRTIRTVIINPHIGLSHRKILFRLLDDGHELGLHGGMDHPRWQWELNSLDKVKLNDLLKPAYDHFVAVFGKPKGFTSPGFHYNRYVLELIDEYGFEYASDMEGERLFKPEGYSHLQIPVNIMGPCRTPLIEHLCSSGFNELEILARCKNEISKRDVCVIYGHPSFEATFGPMKELLSWIKGEEYLISTMGQII